jgi:tryptophan synthase alpha chain
MKLKNPSLIGFGISNHESFSRICQYANGAIIGSAFVKALEINGSSEKAISEFIGLIRGIIK